MPQKKGQTGNPNGRPKGAKNKVTAELKERVKYFIESNLELIEADFKVLEPKERVNFYTQLLKFAIPTKHEAEIQPIQPSVIHHYIDNKAIKLD